MRPAVRRIAAAAALALLAAAPAARAAAPPEVSAVIEGRDAASSRSVLVLLGKGLTKIRSYAASHGGGQFAVDPPLVTVRSRTAVVLALEPGLPAGDYLLSCVYGRSGEGIVVPFRLGGGRDASALAEGTVPTDRYSAYADLEEEGRIGAAAGQVAAGAHLHDGLYLSTQGGTVAGDTGVTGRFAAAASGIVPAVSGTISSGTAAGVAGTSVDGPGVSGLSTFQYGVSGTSANAVGVYGYSTAGSGVNGDSVAAQGVYGRGPVGVRAFSPTTTAFRSDTTGPANHLESHTGANRVARIDAAGTGYFDGGTQTGGADFAEAVAVRGDRTAFAPGAVLVVAEDADRAFALASEAECPRVAGVVSTRPGVLAMPRPCAGEGDGLAAGEVPLAVTGIVPTRVCDEGGPIRRGDLLVTASLPGHARRAPADPRPGTVLGKSLGTLGKGSGVVEVLLTLR
jgi:hypothetical protein